MPASVRHGDPADTLLAPCQPLAPHRHVEGNAGPLDNCCQLGSRRRHGEAELLRHEGELRVVWLRGARGGNQTEEKAGGHLRPHQLECDVAQLVDARHHALEIQSKPVPDHHLQILIRRKRFLEGFRKALVVRPGERQARGIGRYQLDRV